jgi:hypothetical protein
MAIPGQGRIKRRLAAILAADVAGYSRPIIRYALLRLIVAVSASALGGCGLAWANNALNSQASAIAAPSQFSPEIPSQSSSLAR